MNFDLIELWNTLERLPLLFSITVFGLVLVVFALLFVYPTALLFLTEPKQILRNVRSQQQQIGTCYGWRRQLMIAANLSSAFNILIGRTFAWLVLYMTVMQFVVVILRYVFSYGSIQMQESIWYMHGLLFMLGAGYTLVKDGHVRLDLFYREASARFRAYVNLIGSLFFLLPFCIANFDYAWPLVLNSWAVREGSNEAAGLAYVYLFKTAILAFSALLALEGVALALRSLVTLCPNADAGQQIKNYE